MVYPFLSIPIFNLSVVSLARFVLATGEPDFRVYAVRCLSICANSSGVFSNPTPDGHDDSLSDKKVVFRYGRRSVKRLRVDYDIRRGDLRTAQKLAQREYSS
jgi:hypothetical protein